MCTAVSFAGKAHCFGRNLDLEHSYGEGVVITPKNAPLPFRKAPSPADHYSMIGIGIIRQNYPLYFDAINEKGLFMAGLNFPGNAYYMPEAHLPKEKIPVAPFELIPWVLSQCDSLSQAKKLLQSVVPADIPFSEELPSSPLHWFLADASGSLAIEPTSEGLMLYENPVGVLTNNPPFPFHLQNLCQYMQLSPHAPENHLAPSLNLTPFSRGMGAFGLPGDASSPSRFIRTAFTKLHSLPGETKEETVHLFFRILDTAAQHPGCVHLGKDEYEYTRYSSCCTEEGIYYYTTCQNRRITAVSLQEVSPGKELVFYPFLREPDICFQNNALSIEKHRLQHI